MVSQLIISPSFLSVLFLGMLFVPHEGKTDSPDVAALQVMYTSLNSPSQLTGWRANGGDPCGESWKGIECSGSSVTKIRLSGLGLTGSMGYQLSSLTSVKYFDLSKNKLSADIPYQLPPNVIDINLASNKFTGGIPYSISQMTDLTSLNLGHNRLSGQLSEMFGQLPKLSFLDLSFNNLSGNLPQSFASLKSLNTLYLQNNQFSGPIDALGRLPLDDLNVANNQFTGWIPKKLKNLDNIQTQGNRWSDPDGNKLNRSTKGESSKLNLKALVIASVVIGILALVVILLAIVARRSSSPPPSHFLEEDKFSQKRSFSPLVSCEFKDLPPIQSSTSFNSDRSSSVGIKAPPSDWQKAFTNNELVKRFSSKRSTDSMTVTAYSLVDIQAATGSFDSGNKIGQGSIGHVYKAKYADGKVLSVKKLDSTNFQNGGPEDFMDVISSISRLHHPNINELIGYCSEKGYRLLIYNFLKNGSLYDFLHLSDEYSKPLTWNTRIRIALGTARAIEYLHEVCSPSTMHKNIKSANILLDMELNPHLSDCGLASFYQGKSWDSEEGYRAPECTKPSAYSLKSDVYSFGVVMLELLTGRMPFDSSKSRAEQSLVGWATPQLHDIDSLSKMVDPSLRGLYPPKSLSRFADCIALCVQMEPEFRPPMSEVVQSVGRCA